MSQDCLFCTCLGTLPIVNTILCDAHQAIKNHLQSKHTHWTSIKCTAMQICEAMARTSLLWHLKNNNALRNMKTCSNTHTLPYSEHHSNAIIPMTLIIPKSNAQNFTGWNGNIFVYTATKGSTNTSWCFATSLYFTQYNLHSMKAMKTSFQLCRQWW